MENAFASPIATVLSHFDVDEHDGLTNKQVEELRIKYGRNCMFPLRHIPPSAFVLRQLAMLDCELI